MGTPDDEAAIRALFDISGEAWLAADGERLASVFGENADFINIRAHSLRGRDEIARHHTQLFNTIYKGVVFTTGEKRIRFLRPDVATIEFASSGKVGAEERHAHMLAVAVRNNGEWKLEAAHNMVPFNPPTP